MAPNANSLNFQALDNFVLPGLATILTATCLVTLLYLVLGGIYRVFFSPLATFPGPRLAGATYLYEFYYTAIRADFPSKLRSLHESYGSIVRINPGELHVVEHDFNMQHFKSKNLDKGKWYYQLARNALAGLHDHHEHKQRRSLLDPLFNGGMLTQFIPSIDEHISNFRIRLEDAAQTRQPLNMSHLFWALMNDIVAQHLLGCNLDGLLIEDLSLVAKTRSYSALHIVGYLRQWPLNFLFEIRYLPLIRMIVPMTGSEDLVKKHTKTFFSPSTEIGKPNDCVAKRLHTQSSVYRDQWRLAFECSELMISGGEALTYNATHVLYNLLTNPECLNRVRTELAMLNSTYDEVWRDPGVVDLPYLNAVISESLRLNDTAAIRFPRESPDPIFYRGKLIPAGHDSEFYALRPHTLP
ncbi:cytochrome P450 [Venturia nashicola]|uniref:Cytochrome P450 n=1 Tax=Venturia nashicola TaxID=86259 RepID=A0A4Z1PC69_9PEZI|nr:cytochrome P450 [Venturia nashicola]TLD29391.1 cytochrome P450 [Venturia nashicola]